MENLTNEEKAKEICMNIVQPYTDFIYQNYKTAMEIAVWKDEQHKQELIRIYNFVSPYLTPEANNDLKIIIGI